VSGIFTPTPSDTYQVRMGDPQGIRMLAEQDANTRIDGTVALEWIIEYGGIGVPCPPVILVDGE
jgi:hypothetical protein